MLNKGWTSEHDSRIVAQREKTTPYGLREIFPVGFLDH